MKSIKFFGLSLTVAAALASHSFTTRAQNGTPARNPSTPNQAAQDADSADVFVRRVSLPISVLDKKGAPVAGLTANDFFITEDKQPQRIETFAINSNNLPIYVGVLMDTSSSTAGKMDFQQEAAMNFIHTVTRLRKDKVAFATFDDDVALRQDFTDKLDLLDKAVHKTERAGSHTSLYDSIYRFCDEKMRGVNGLRALVVITDGDDTYSRATLAEAIEMAQATETIIFAISTKAGFSGVVPGVEAGTVRDRGDRELERMCQETGGRAFFTGDTLALERAFTRIANELRSQYIVFYRPTNQNYDGSFRRIEVRLAKDKDNMKVRTRRGYKAIATNAQGNRAN